MIAQWPDQRKAALADLLFNRTKLPSVDDTAFWHGASPHRPCPCTAHARRRHAAPTNPSRALDATFLARASSQTHRTG